MLVLTRRVGEKLVIGNEIVIEVVAVSGDVVRLGVVAPRETSIHRYEVFSEIQEANRKASAPTLDAPTRTVKDLAARLLRANADEPETDKSPNEESGDR